MDDKPNFDETNHERTSRQNEMLAAGDVIQAWRFRKIKEKRTREIRGEYRWIDGDVLAVVETPCKGVDWVAMIQWREGNEVIEWDAIPSHSWRATSCYRRKPPT